MEFNTGQHEFVVFVCKRSAQDGEAIPGQTPDLTSRSHTSGPRTLLEDKCGADCEGFEVAIVRTAAASSWGQGFPGFEESFCNPVRLTRRRVEFFSRSQTVCFAVDRCACLHATHLPHEARCLTTHSWARRHGSPSWHGGRFCISQSTNPQIKSARSSHWPPKRAAALKGRWINHARHKNTMQEHCIRPLDCTHTSPKSAWPLNHVRLSVPQPTSSKHEHCMFLYSPLRRTPESHLGEICRLPPTDQDIAMSHPFFA